MSCEIHIAASAHPLFVNYNIQREINGLPPTTPFNPKRENSPLLVREYSNTSRTRSRAHSQTSQSSSRSRSRSRARGMPMMRKQSLGAHAAFNAFADAEIDNGGPDRNRSLTPMRTRACSTEEDVHTESLTLPLIDIVSVDREVPSTRKRQSSGGSSDFFSSKISDTGSGFLLSPPKPPDSYRSKNALYYRIFVHTSTNGYIEFSFDNTNSHDILMAFLSAHLKPNQLPRKTPNDPIISPSDGALRTVVLTPTKLQQPPQLTRSMSIDSACTLDKLQKKMIRQRLQQETTPLGRIRENLANWMSSIVDCACCQDTTTVAPDPSDKNASKKGIVDESPESKLLKKQGIGGLSFEESSTTLSPQLSFEKSVATNHGST